MKKSFFWIGGNHSIDAAIKNNKRSIRQIISIKAIDNYNEYNFKIKNKNYIDNLFKKYPNFNHQNIAAEISELPNYELKEEISELKKLIILDGITNVGNVGAIMRSALAFDFDGMIINKRNIDLKNPSIYKTSSGAIEKLKIFMVTNLNNSLNLLKENNFWSYAIDLSGSEYLDTLKINSHKNVIILGSENKGISQNILKNSDHILKIKMSNNVESLNVSNAACIALSKFYNI